MKIVIFCHGKPRYCPTGLLTPEEFAGLAKKEEESGICPVPEYLKVSTDRIIYTGSSPLGLETAKQLFDRADVIPDRRLDAIPEMPFCRKKSLRLPAPVWRWIAAFARTIGGRCQPESVRMAGRRAAALMDDLEKENRDCILISHRNYIPCLIREMRKRKYEYRRSGSFGIAYLEKIAAQPAVEHCGGCGHNCPLSRPGCYVGEDAARMRKRKK